jgi:tetratricopeptide (TPR) repeat protein
MSGNDDHDEPEVPDRGYVTPMPELKRILQGGDDALAGASLSLREGSPEMHYLVASRELQEGNLSHGFAHLCDLLAFDPDHPEWNALYEGYRRAHGGDLESLLPDGEERYFAYEAVRARCMAERGELEEAVSLLMAVVDAKPSSPYLEDWALDWLEPAGALEGLSREAGLSLLVTGFQRFGESSELTAPRLRAARRLARLGSRFVDRHGPSEQTDMFVPGMYRKAGIFDEALRHAREAEAERPSWHAHVAVGLIHRQSGDPEQAELAFRRAARTDPGDASALLELGDTWFNVEQWVRARRAYEEVLDRDAGNDWATASIVWCRWREGATGPASAADLPDELGKLAEQGNDRAIGLWNRFAWYHGVLPAPSDAMAKLIREVIDDDASIESASASDVEAPSNLVAYALFQRSRGGNERLEVQWGNVATPDPREPVEPVAYTLWRRDGELLVPALPAPPPDLQQQVARLAAQPYRPLEHWARASQLGARLGPGAVEPLLACIGHPPAPPPGADLLEWVMRVQHAVAQTAAHLDDGWNDSVRRAALFSLLLGPRDWSTEAAIVALSRLADDLEWIALDVHSAFRKLDHARPDSGAVCYEEALYHFWSNLPQLFPDEREELEERLNALVDDEA